MGYVVLHYYNSFLAQEYAIVVSTKMQEND